MNGIAIESRKADEGNGENYDRTLFVSLTDFDPEARWVTLVVQEQGSSRGTFNISIGAAEKLCTALDLLLGDNEE